MTQETTQEARTYLPPIHTSMESAHIIEDYPYGFKLRCRKRMWVETNDRGQRIIDQTTNPKKPGEVWNKPKMSTYSMIQVLYRDDKGHIQVDGLNIYSDEERIAAFEARAGAALGDHEKKMIAMMREVREKTKNIKYTIQAGPVQRIV